MTKMLVIAKAVLILLGIHTISKLLYVCASFSRHTPAIWLSSVKYALMIILGFLFYQLIIKGDKWAHYLIGRPELKITGELASFALKVYRITVVMCGIFIVYFAVGKIVAAVIALFDPSQFEQHKIYDDFLYATGRIMMEQWAVIIKIILGIYLLLGAPRFVRRQVEKTLSYINQKAGTISQHVQTIGKED